MAAVLAVASPAAPTHPPPDPLPGVLAVQYSVNCESPPSAPAPESFARGALPTPVPSAVSIRR